MHKGRERYRCVCTPTILIRSLSRLCPLSFFLLVLLLEHFKATPGLSPVHPYPHQFKPLPSSAPPTPDCDRHNKGGLWKQSLEASQPVSPPGLEGHSARHWRGALPEGGCCRRGLTQHQGPVWTPSVLSPELLCPACPQAPLAYSTPAFAGAQGFPMIYRIKFSSQVGTYRYNSST